MHCSGGFQYVGVEYVDHYLNDFVSYGPPNVDTCLRNLQQIKSTCGRLGVPLALENEEGPRTCITFLGIQIDTVKGTLALPHKDPTRVGDMGD